MFHCRYDFLAFGSWVLEVGTPHRRLQISLDGKEQLLRCSMGQVKNAASVPVWELQETLPLEPRDEPDLGPRVVELLRKHLGLFGR
jgi:hypothetical protein